jgi:hypothetical protein
MRSGSNGTSSPQVSDPEARDSAFAASRGNRAWTDTDREVADVMSSYRVNFAASGEEQAAFFQAYYDGLYARRD